METKLFNYPVVIREHYLDSLGHMHNTVYQTLLEEALWEFMHENGYGLKQLVDQGFAPVLLESSIKYLKELKLRDEILIETHLASVEGKVVKMEFHMVRNGEVCCSALITLGLLNLKERKLAAPTPEWIKSLGITDWQA